MADAFDIVVKEYWLNQKRWPREFGQGMTIYK